MRKIFWVALIFIGWTNLSSATEPLLPPTRIVRMQNMVTEDGPIRYNATRTYSGSIIALNIPREVNVTFREAGETGNGTPYNIRNTILAAAGHWTNILNGAMTIQAIEDGAVTVGAREDIWRPTGVAVTFAPGVDIDPMPPLPPEVPATGAMFFRQTIVMPSTNMRALETLYGTTDREKIVQHYYFAVIMHEFGHLLGLDHPTGIAGTRTTTRFTLAASDPFQLMGNTFHLLADLHEHVNRLPLTDQDITPAPGELAALLEILNQNCYPDPGNAFVLPTIPELNSSTCSIPSAGIEYNEAAEMIGARFLLSP